MSTIIFQMITIEKLCPQYLNMTNCIFLENTPKNTSYHKNKYKITYPKMKIDYICTR